jgi:uncharacterized protein (TIGR00730 family)
MLKSITVFGSAKPLSDDEQYVFGYELGKKLAESGFNVVTGGFNGIMEAVSKGANEIGMDAIGVTVDTWGSKPNRYLTKEFKCNSLFERVQKLIELGDGFAVLQGGTGTLLELAAVWELCNKKIMNWKPVACHSSMWKEIIAIMNLQMKKENRDTETIKVFRNIDEIVDYLKSNV